MKYIIFAIDTHVEEFLFIFEYKIGENRMVLGELIKLNNLCYIKDFDFDFFEIAEDPNHVLNKEGIYIYKYKNFTDVLHRLNVQLNPSEMDELKIKNREILSIMTKKSKSEILAIIHQQGKYYDLFQKMFETKIDLYKKK